MLAEKVKIKQKRGFLDILLGSLGANALGSPIAGKRPKAKVERHGWGVIAACEEKIKAGQDF